MPRILKIEDWKKNKPQFRFHTDKHSVIRLKDELLFLVGHTPHADIRIVRFREDLIYVDLVFTAKTHESIVTLEINSLPELCGFD